MVHDTRLINLIKEIKKKKKAVILVHNYQAPEMYEVADHIGDSLALSRKAQESDAKIILFCGVRFMAETAKILNPTKKVLLPTLDAGCSLADMATPEKLIELKKKYPDAAVVAYVNTSAEVKALSDVCCTSANAVEIVKSIPQNQIIFLPDKNLGRYVQSKTGKDIILWDGYCFVHDKLDAETLKKHKAQFPGAKVIAHPEAREDLLEHADHISGTGGMAKFAKSHDADSFIVVTECGMTDILRQDVPEKKFHSFCTVCPYMKATSMLGVLQSLVQEKNEITLSDDIIKKARSAIDAMIAVGGR